MDEQQLINGKKVTNCRKVGNKWKENSKKKVRQIRSKSRETKNWETGVREMCVRTANKTTKGEKTNKHTQTG